MATLDQLRDRVLPWCAPISDARPGGVPASTDPRHEFMQREIGGIDSPVTERAPNWRAVIAAGEELLREVSKDLFVAAWLAYAYFRAEGIEGLARGVVLLAELMGRHWEGMFPEPRRMRGRANAVEWLARHAGQTLSGRALDGRDRAALETLDAAVRRLSDVVRARFVEGAPQAPSSPDGRAIAALLDALTVHLERPVAAMLAALPSATTVDLSGIPDECIEDEAKYARAWIDAVKPGEPPLDPSGLRGALAWMFHESTRDEFAGFFQGSRRDELAGFHCGTLMLDGARYLEEVGKDLSVAVGLVWSRGGMERFSGFGWTFAALVGMAEAHWATMTPPPAACDQRARELRWLLTWAVQWLDRVQSIEPERHGAWALGMIRVSTRRLDVLARARLSDPELCRGMLDAVERLHERANGNTRGPSAPAGRVDPEKPAQNAREHHYRFAFQTLPATLRTGAGRRAFLGDLIGPTPQPVLDFIWNDCAKEQPPVACLPSTGLSASSFDEGCLRCVIVEMPPPLASPEAHFAALLVDPAAGALRRYLTLERAAGNAHPMIGEWFPGGGRLNHGSGPPAVVGEFAAYARGVAARMNDDQTAGEALMQRAEAAWRAGDVAAARTSVVDACAAFDRACADERLMAALWALGDRGFADHAVTRAQAAWLGFSRGVSVDTALNAVAALREVLGVRSDRSAQIASALMLKIDTSPFDEARRAAYRELVSKMVFESASPGAASGKAAYMTWIDAAHVGDIQRCLAVCGDVVLDLVGDSPWLFDLRRTGPPPRRATPNP